MRRRRSKLSLRLEWPSGSLFNWGVLGRSSEAIFLDAPVERSPAQTQGISRMAYIARGPCQRLTNEDSLHCLKTHLIEALCRNALCVQTQISSLDAITPGHQNSALNRVIELPNIPRPPVLQ